MLTLYQFQISHFCEKVRWAMDHKGLEYRVVNLVPGPHIRQTLRMARRTGLPILEHDGEVIQNSSDILTYLDQQFPEKCLTPAGSDGEAALRWERELDQEIGVHLRRVAYGTLLDYPRIVCPLFTSSSPLRDKALMRLIFPGVRRKMRSFMDIRPETVEISREHLFGMSERLAEHLQDRDYIVGDSLTRADLTAAVLLAPAFGVQCGSLSWPSPLPEPLESDCREIRARLPWVKKIYEQYR